MINTSSLAAVPRLVKPETLPARIYGDLLVRLQRGEIAADTRLVDTDIGRLFGTSRVPAREALLRLMHEGYLVGTTRGFRVPRLSDQDIRDIFEIRRLLEPRAAALAATSMTSSGLDVLRDGLERAGDAARECDVLAMIAANTVFRQGWLGVVKNHRLSSTIGRFADHVQVVRLETLRNAETQHYVADGLADLLSLFEASDATGVGTRMSDFIDVAERSFFALRAGEKVRSR